IVDRRLPGHPARRGLRIPVRGRLPAELAVDPVTRRAGEPVVAAYRIVAEAEVLVRVDDTAGERAGEPRREPEFDAEVTRSRRIGGAQRDAGFVTQAQQLVADPR